MFWQDEEETQLPKVTDEVVDLAFAIKGRELPCDHAWLLMEAIRAVLPWFGDDPAHGLHLVNPAPSGNGWYSPTDMEEERMYLPRRTKLMLRLPKAATDAARELEGAVLDVGGSSLAVGEGEIRLLSLHTTLNARHVIGGDPRAGEAEFLEWAHEQLERLGVQAKRMVVGRTTVLKREHDQLVTRSLMLADLKPDESLEVQRSGLGAERRMGCGIFVPHKSVRNILGE
ncbi:MAG: type I-MYXAN CRISPR-associated protein Cas6/Cmx6 [Gammaproteobacteria bacterium]